MSDTGTPSAARSRVAVLVAALVAAALAAGVTAGFSGDDDRADTMSAAATGSTQAPAGPELLDRALLPNMRSLPATNISMQGTGDDREVRFDGILANVGPGPLEVVPDESRPCPIGQRFMAQSVYQDEDENDRFDRAADRLKALRPAGCMLFHLEHTHWHLDASARYWLTSAADGEVVVDQPKVSFCLRDSEKMVPGVANAPARIAYGKCARDRRQGISVGWQDVYEADLPGQVLELPDALPSGVYCLRIAADPLELIEESDEGDNASVTAVRITGPRLRPAPASACT
jgi:hypothetical protein